MVFSMTDQTDHFCTSSPVKGTTAGFARAFLVFIFLGTVVGVAVSEFICAIPDEDIAERSARAWAKLRKSYDAKTLEEVLALADDEIDIATAALLIAKEFDPDIDVSELRNEIDELTSAILKEVGSRRDPRKAIGILNGVIFLEHRFRFRSIEGDGTHGLLSKTLQTRRGNCLGLSTLHLAIGLRLGLPVHMVNVPRHVFVRYADDETRVNIECTAGGARKNDQFYREEHQVTPDQPYLKDLSIRQAIAILLYNSGQLWQDRDGDNKALADYETASELDPTQPKAHLLRSEMLRRMSRLSEASAAIELAIRLDRKYAKAYVVRGTIAGDKKDDVAALADASRALELDATMVEAYRLQARIWTSRDEHKRVIESATTWIGAAPRDAQAHVFRMASYYLLGDSKKAAIDGERALELMPEGGEVTVKLTFPVKELTVLAGAQTVRVVENGIMIEIDLHEFLRKLKAGEPIVRLTEADSPTTLPAGRKP
jgi:regulator of sirC expression with transglutaminase-like and TPR domain